MEPPAALLPPKSSVHAKPRVQSRESRRFFLLALIGSWLGIAWTALSAALVGMLLGTIRFLFPNVLSEPPSKFKAGTPAEYEPESVNVRYKSQHAWIVRHELENYGNIIYALSTTCTHLGCIPNWLEREQKFKCPCHGSGFRITGVNFEGPAPRPLERWAISLSEDGQIVVDKSKHFQKELGQWSDPDSFLRV